ncbi:hypothetical protein PVAP13_2KG428220 [Panicum virgatum]|uniref:Uncharacterized protein n=1 Tax=Panicum virgatum TaxID=38727 RepID=A0A8T0W7Y3_PANVG|nr:hypothetical protein PVAP13_2KG428220 [Panicum virgatum]
MLQGNTDNTVQEKKRKSHMEQIRFATMSSEKRAERNIKRRERYNSNKKGVNVGKPDYDAGIWEPDEEMLAAQEEEDLDCRAPDCCPDLDDFADDEARVYHANDVKIVSFRESEVVILDNDLYERVYKDMTAGHLVLRKIPICEYCGAIRLPNEGLNFCCGQGKVNIVSTPILPDLCRLFTSQTDRDALYFRKNIRYFNSHFSLKGP